MDAALQTLRCSVNTERRTVRARRGHSSDCVDSAATALHYDSDVDHLAAAYPLLDVPGWCPVVLPPFGGPRQSGLVATGRCRNGQRFFEGVQSADCGAVPAGRPD